MDEFIQKPIQQDITFCKGVTCPIKEDCNRFLRMPRDRQDFEFFQEEPYNKISRNCLFFLFNKPKEDKKIMRRGGGKKYGR